METVRLRIATTDGSNYDVSIQYRVGSAQNLHHLIPEKLREGVWVNRDTFIFGHSIAQAKIIEGQLPHIPGQV